MKLDKKTKSAAAAYILGLRPIVEIKGTSNNVSAFVNVLESSKRLYEVLNSEPTATSVAEALADKSQKAKNFANVCGQQWPF